MFIDRYLYLYYEKGCGSAFETRVAGRNAPSYKTRILLLYHEVSAFGIMSNYVDTDSNTTRSIERYVRRS
jgi:hypothetical protein